MSRFVATAGVGVLVLGALGAWLNLGRPGPLAVDCLGIAAALVPLVGWPLLQRMARQRDQKRGGR